MLRDSINLVYVLSRVMSSMNISLGQKKHIFAVGAIALGLSSVFIGSAPAQALVLNGDFSDGFTGWDTLGPTSITSGGNPAAQLGVGGTQSTSSIESFLGLTPGSLAGLSSKNNALFNGANSFFGGSAIKQSFTANAGDVVSFAYNFTTQDYLPFNDFAFTTLSSSIEGLASVKLVGNVEGNTTSTGPKTYSWVAPTTGTYTLGLGVINVGDDDVGTTLVVDNASTTAVPTPALLPGLIGLGVSVWRKRKGESNVEVSGEA